MVLGFLTQFAETCTSKAIGFLPTWYKYLDGEIVEGKCTPKFNFPADLNRILLAIFEIVLRIGGIVAVVFIFVGGFQYLLSQGEPDKAKNARTTIFNALIGLLLAIFATAIVNLVARNIT